MLLTQGFLRLPEDDPCVLCTLKLLEGYSKSPANTVLMLSTEVGWSCDTAHDS